MSSSSENLSLVIIGASGDLARKKIYPALFALYCQGFLPARCRIFGFARSCLSTDEFRARIREHLTCRYVPGESCEEKMDHFLAQCLYVCGEYDSTDAFLDLYTHLREHEGDGPVNRLFYLAIPPSIFSAVARSIGSSGMVNCDEPPPWSRVVLEKPFGRDRVSSDQMTQEILKVFSEPQVYRIDHYLGKEVIQNLMVLRFANRIFEPLWSRRHIRDVQIDWKEDIGTEGRGGYFDAYGILRDVVQNHLLQILSLVAMEPPARFDAPHIRQEKVRLLRSIPPPLLATAVLGQYVSTERGGIHLPGYRDDPTVAAHSTTPTYAAVALEVRNERWHGVPFVIRAGKALDGRMTEIRIRFRQLPENIFAGLGFRPDANELVIRIQPDESIYLQIVSKIPGLKMSLETRRLDLRYKAAFTEIIPDAYESLLLEVMRGERSLFIGNEELEAAWDVFTPLLHEIEDSRVKPEPYAFGSSGPISARLWEEGILEKRAETLDA
jgi:glucose-6-phosphate 1-dehydrogenase